MPRRETKSYPIAGLKAIDTETGTFEAVVSVFGNVDLHGHRIDPGAFDASIDRWRASGDPIPVIFSHQWDDLSSYLGTIDPGEVRALPAGDSELPEAIRENGGLFVKGQLDTTEPEGRKAAKLLKSRAVREFSFAYDVFDEAKAEDGYLDLLELDLIEIGPTLKGANPLTQLVGAKSASLTEEVLAEVAEAFELDPETVTELAAALEELASADAAGEEVDDVEEAPAAEPLEPVSASRRKAWVRYQPAGTVEAFLASIRDALVAEALDRYAGNLYDVQVEGTFTDEARVLFYVELWDEGAGDGTFYEASYDVEGETVTLGDWSAVELEVTAKPKSRGLKEGRRNATADLGRIQGIHDLTRELGATCETADEDPDGAADDDEDDGKAAKPSVLRATLEAELLEIG